MAKEVNPATGFKGQPVTVYLKHPATCRGTVQTFYKVGREYDLAYHLNGVMVTFHARNGSPAVDTLVPWSNVANIIVGDGE